MRRTTDSTALATALLCAGCGQQAAVTTVPTAATAAAGNSTAQANPDAQCKSWGIQPGSPGYKQCVDGLTDAANATAGTADPQGAGQLQADAAKTRADMAQQGQDLRKQIKDQIKAAAADPKCVTVTNGTNTSTSCP